MFCLNDGTSLLYDSGASGNRIVFPNSGEMPTQFINRSQNISAVPQKDSSKWLFLAIGILGTALIGVSAILFWTQFGGKKEENTSKTENKSTVSENKSANSAANVKTETTPANEKTPAVVQSTIDPNLTPSGDWSGDWASKSANYTATASFTEVNGKVSGRIYWTLQKTSNPNKSYKVGSNATEYVEGVYNPATRLLSLRGVRKDDPNGIIILDKYNLTLAQNNRTLSGKSINGNFVLRK